MDYEIKHNSMYKQTTVGEITVKSILKKLDESLDVFGAFGYYLVQRAKTKEMQKRFEAACNYIEKENQEILKQYSIIEKEYGERLVMEIEYLKNKYRMQAKEIEQETRNLAEDICEQSKLDNISRVRPKIKMIKLYLCYLEKMKNTIDSIASSTEEFVIKNYYYYQLNEEYIENFSVLQKYLNVLVTEQEV